MSAVRMCDNCGVIFSENSDDWTTFTGRQKVRNQETKRIEFQQVDQDWCGMCVNKQQNTSPKAIEYPGLQGTTVERGNVD